jgi:hypothetical protein
VDIVWKAELSREMMSHLSLDKQHELMRTLSEQVDFIAAAYEVGKEFKHELRTTT